MQISVGDEQWVILVPVRVESRHRALYEACLARSVIKYLLRYTRQFHEANVGVLYLCCRVSTAIDEYAPINEYKLRLAQSFLVV